MKIRIGVPGERLGRWLGRTPPFGISLACHLLTVWIIVNLPPDLNLDPEPTRVEGRLIPPKDAPAARVLYIPKRDSLPQVSPGTKSKLVLPRARRKQEQTIITAGRPRPKPDQFIFVDMPKVTQQQPLPSPNLITLKAIEAPPPPKKVVRAFSAPPTRAQTPNTAELVAPDLTIRDTPPPVPSQNPLFLPAPSAAVPDAPNKPVESKAQTMQSASTATDARGNLAIISSNPAEGAPTPRPEGNRNSGIVAGGDPSGKRKGQAGGTAGVIIPGLAVQGGPPSTATASVTAPKPTPPVPPPPRPNVPLPPAASTAAVALPQWPNARSLPTAVEALFPNRPVFTTVVPSPAGSSFLTIWFAEVLASPPGTRIFMRPMVPRLAPWPLSREMVAMLPEAFMVTGRVGRDGRFTPTSLLQPAPKAVSDTLIEVFSNWIFTPAIRNGVAVDVDVLFSIRMPPRRMTAEGQ